MFSLFFFCFCFFFSIQLFLGQSAHSSENVGIDSDRFGSQFLQQFVHQSLSFLFFALEGVVFISIINRHSTSGYDDAAESFRMSQPNQIFKGHKLHIICGIFRRTVMAKVWYILFLYIWVFEELYFEAVIDAEETTIWNREVLCPSTQRLLNHQFQHPRIPDLQFVG